MKSILIALGVFTSMAFASDLSVKDREFLHQYHQSRAEMALPSDHVALFAFAPNCTDPNAPSCMKVACAQGGYNCSFSSGLDHIASSCKGTDGACVEAACKQGGYNCGFSSGIDHVLSMCHESVGACVQAACAQGGYNCSFSSGLDHIMSSCKGVDGRCVTDTCAQGGYNCSFSSGLDHVLSLCGN